jgi:hypothetical protein
MQLRFFWRGVQCSLAALLVLALFGQEPSKPVIAGVKVLPSEPIPSGSCTSSTAGYIEKNGRTDFTDAEFGQMILSALKGGYVLTLYPRTKSGIFIFQECATAQHPRALKVP